MQQVWLVGMMVLAWAPIVGAYDPLAVPKGPMAKEDYTISDAKRQREIPVRVYLPTEKSAAPIVLFSHGLGGARTNSEYLGQHWAGRGYVAVFMQHHGSDEGVWKDAPLGERVAKLKQAAGVENLQLRAQDVTVVLDELTRWQTKEGHPLKGRLDLKHVGMSGHSFGAVTTQAVSGQSFPLGRSATDSRIQAAVLMSPSAPKLGDPKRAFGNVAIPWLLLTGTKDTSPINNTEVKDRLAVFPALPKGNKYELVLANAEHSAFGDRALPGETEKRNPNHHRAILATTTAFWDAHLRGNAEALKWLEGEAVRTVLDKADTWQKK